ncbi:MAG TPA: UDP-3-O-(3-hydroxymyristoyl)glucosamine N-acyltransferase [Candidatus Baltobacteraceae bacterium]|nr:UDP-3-O-(3-hydroxymyristoyl)glucosamine N-acyltransferase [Candidatus Baltobacteraceae bacterium]
MLGTLAQLAGRVGGRTAGDQTLAIARIAAIDEAGPDALTFATTPTYLQAALRSHAAAVLVDEGLLRQAQDDAIRQDDNALAKPLIIVENARVALMQLLRGFDRPRKRGPFVHPSAVVDASATIGADVYIGPNVVVSAASRIGDRAVLDAGTFVGEDAAIGADTTLYPHAAVMDGCIVGDRAIVHPGAVIGSEGFGYVFVDGRFERIPQVGNVVLGDDVEIGSNTCIDRAQTGSTNIGTGTKIDNLCQIGHNCRIGAHTGMAAQTGLAGSTIVGDYVLIGGQAGFKGHITIGSRVKIAAGAKVWSDIADDAFVSGTPARPHQEDLRREVMVRSLPKLVARVDALEKKLRES